MSVTYNVYRDGEKIKDGIAEKTYTDTGLTPDTEYNYQVSAVNEYGESELSDSLSVRTLVDPTTSTTTTESPSTTTSTTIGVTSTTTLATTSTTVKPTTTTTTEPVTTTSTTGA